MKIMDLRVQKCILTNIPIGGKFIFSMESYTRVTPLPDIVDSIPVAWVVDSKGFLTRMALDVQVEYIPEQEGEWGGYDEMRVGEVFEVENSKGVYVIAEVDGEDPDGPSRLALLNLDWCSENPMSFLTGKKVRYLKYNFTVG